MIVLSALRTGACGGLAVVLASFSLLLQALLPLTPAGSPASEPGMPNWTMASLCLSQDAAVPDRHGTPARQEPGKDSPVCPVCLGLHLISAYVPPSTLGIPLPSLVRDNRMASRLAAAPVEAWRAASQARGPPTAA
jgi:hypothetical protein